MSTLTQKLKNLVRYAVVSAGADNTKQFPVQQITYKGKVAEGLAVSPYGLYANISNDALALVFSIEGDESSKAFMAYTPKDRPDDLEQDEVALYHPPTKTFIKFRNTGDVEIDTDVDGAGGNLIINTASATVNATGDVDVTADNVNVNATGDVDVTADNVNVDASAVNLGVGGAAIARQGDAVQVTVTSGSSAGTYSGTITAGGTNTSI